LKKYTSSAMVSSRETPDQITTATLKEMPLIAFLKVYIPISKKKMPSALMPQSVRPLDFVKNIFQMASHNADIIKKKPALMTIEFLADKSPIKIANRQGQL